MEPLLTNEGLKVMQDKNLADKLLEDYFRRQGYHVITEQDAIAARKAKQEKSKGS